MNKEQKKKFIIDYLKSAKRRIENSNLALDENDYAFVVRNCQEIVELCSKTLILRWGFVVPEKHDLRKELEENKELFSINFQDNIIFIKNLSRDLRIEREISFYGDAETSISPSELYSKKLAQKYLNDTKKFYNICKVELKEFLDKI